MSVTKKVWIEALEEFGKLEITASDVSKGWSWEAPKARVLVHCEGYEKKFVAFMNARLGTGVVWIKNWGGDRNAVVLETLRAGKNTALR